MTGITAVQAAMAITSPVTMSVKKAWPYMPPQSVLAGVAMPAWINEWTLVRERRAISMREQLYSVRMQLLVFDADQDRAADIATAFMVVAVDAFDAAVTLGGTATQQTLRGASPTLGRVEIGGAVYSAIDLFLDVEMKEAKEFTG